MTIFGDGGIRLSAVLGAAMVGAFPIIAVDIVDEKLEKARRIGATHIVNSSRCNRFPRVLEITGKLGVDCAVEAAGKVKIMGTAFRSVRDLVRVVHMIITFALTRLFVHYLLRHKDLKLSRVFSGNRNKEDLG